ncbi:unnamed protein product [marine sediment metagenome]|uniref:Carboxypeptidase regulatory-like domain-containing protein n=1 Tax=marine sediment metagenome TaxID=412755 RepID=X1SPI0_9ZZZZ
MKEEGRRISPALVIVPIAAGLGLVAVAALAFAGPPAPPPGRANLYGKVNDAATGEPISGVLVTLNGLEVYTDAGGNYIFEDLEPGTYSGSASKEGYETAYF